MGQVNKVLIIGAKGMAGHVVKNYLESNNNYEVWGLARGVKPEKNLICLDVFNTEKLKLVFSKHSFDVVVNNVGLLNKTAEDNPEQAIWLNSYFPHLLARLGKTYNFKLIHISTDCVFSGKQGNYSEDSFKNGIGFYAVSKSLGEVINDQDLTFRTSIIGPELKKNGIGLFHWFMNQTEKISGFTGAYWSGVTTLELAKAINKAIDQNLTGLYQLVNNKKINKYDLLNEINSVFRDGKVTIIRNNEYKVDKSLLNTRKDFDYKVPSYFYMIKEMKEWFDKYPELYSHYK